MMVDRDIVRFCSIECRLQQSGELSVGWMVDAWLYAQEASTAGYTTGLDKVYRLPTIDDVINIGRLVEPNVNVGPGFRRVDVRVGWDVKMNWENVPTAMVALMEGLYEPPARDPRGFSIPVLTPNTFFKQYEDIHPWRDGNGRSGQVLYNWLNRTLDNPVWSTDFWNDPRRTVGYGAS